MLAYPYANIPQSSSLVEIVDAGGVPIMVMEASEARRLMLPRRAAAVALYDRNDKIFVARRGDRSDIFPGLWAFTAMGLAQAPESIEDAAARALHEHVGRIDVSLSYKGELSPDAGALRLSLFMAGPVKSPVTPDGKLCAQGIFMDYDEIVGLKKSFPEIFIPQLAESLDKGLLFDKKTKKISKS